MKIKDLDLAKKEDILKLLQVEKADILDLMHEANTNTHGNITYSKNVFIPLTEVCRNYCGYCTFRKDPEDPETLILKDKESIFSTLKNAEKYNCTEALFTFGEYADTIPLVKKTLEEEGYSTMLEYLYEVCEETINTTTLLPHSNPGVASYNELKKLKQVNASMGMMLENSSKRLLELPAHKDSPGKDPEIRLQVLQDAGKLKIPFTTGILIGIGETQEETAQSLLDLRKIQNKYGHIQEIIIQNFKTKPGIPMENHPEPTLLQMIRTVATAQILFPDVSIQVPPNLNILTSQTFLLCGADDWGGVSPLTKDYVNPEAPWPQIKELEKLTKDAGYQLKERLPVYEKYINTEYLSEKLLNKTIKLQSQITQS